MREENAQSGDSIYSYEVVCLVDDVPWTIKIQGSFGQNAGKLMQSRNN